MVDAYTEEALDNTRVGVALAHEAVVYARENKEDLGILEFEVGYKTRITCISSNDTRTHKDMLLFHAFHILKSKIG